MRGLPRRGPPGVIDQRNPVADHELNVGLERWWLGVPGWTGGPDFVDLTQRKRAGLSGAAWKPGRTAALAPAVGAVADYVDTQLFDLSGDGTVSWWFKPVGSAGDGVTRYCWTHLHTVTYDFSAQKYLDGNLYFGWYSGGEYRVILGASSANYTQGVWQQYTLTWGAAGTVLYRNGVAIGSNATPPVTAGPLAYQLLFFNLAGTGSRASVGDQLDDFRLYRRQQSAAFVGKLYDDAARGYPNTLRRLRPWSAGVEVTGGSSSATDTDSGVRTEVGAILSILTAAEGGTGSEAATLAGTATGSDAATQADLAAISAALVGPDSATGADAATAAAQVAVSDGGAEAVTLSIAARLATSDTGTDSEAGGDGSVVAPDTGTGGEVAAVTAAAATAESGGGGEAGAGVGALALTEAGLGLESAVTVRGVLLAAETGLATEVPADGASSARPLRRFAVGGVVARRFAVAGRAGARFQVTGYAGADDE